MSEISGLNIFGNLTAKNGVKLTFNDINLNKDGKISEEELNTLLKANDIDTVQLSNIDNNDDKMISEDEFVLYKYKMQIQEQLNNFQGKISMDFSGELSTLIPNVIAQLKDLTNIFVENNISNPKKMVEDYKVELPLNYEKIKANILATQTEPTEETSPATTAPVEGGNTTTNEIVSRVLDEIVSAYMDELAETVPNITTEQIEAGGQALGHRLETIITNYVANYTGNNLEADIRAYVEEVLNQTESERMVDDYQKYQDVYNSLGAYIDRGDMAKLRDAAKQLLTTALAEGVKIVINGQEVTDEAAIVELINSYNNASALNADIKALMDALSNNKIKDSILKGLNTSIATSSDIAIESENLNLDFLNYDKGYSSHWDKYVERDARELIDRELKQQLYNQIKADLEAKGLSMDEFNDMFELCYKQSLDKAVDISITKDNSWWSRYSYDSNELVANFLTIFNENLANAVDTMYKSDKDIDIVDIDVDNILSNKNYRLRYSDRKTIENFNNAINNDQTITVKHNGIDKLVKQADLVLEQFRETLQAKALGFCQANGLEFNQEQFDEIFNSTKDATIDASITVESKYPNLKGFLSRYFTSATLDPKELVNNFLNNFKTNYENAILG